MKSLLLVIFLLLQCIFGDRVLLEPLTAMSKFSKNLSLPRFQSNLVVAGNRIFILGGISLVNSTASAAMDVYTIGNELQPLGSFFSGKIPKARSFFATVGIGNVIFSAGGYFQGQFDKSVDVLNTSTMVWSTILNGLSVARSNLSATFVYDVVIFAGGFNGQVKNTIDIYNLTRAKFGNIAWTTKQLSVARMSPAVGTSGKVAVFAGGYVNNLVESKAVDIVSTTILKWTSSTLKIARRSIAAVSVGTYLIFAGGYITNITDLSLIVSSNMDIYDSVSGLWTSKYLPTTISCISGTGIGFRAIFVGCYDPNVYLYSVITQTFSKLENMFAERIGFGIISISSTILIASGQNLDKLSVSTIELFGGCSTNMLTTGNICKCPDNLVDSGEECVESYLNRANKSENLGTSTMVGLIVVGIIILLIISSSLYYYKIGRKSISDNVPESDRAISIFNFRRKDKSKTSCDQPNEILPDGWSKHLNSSGNIYYYNQSTQVSTWVRPALVNYS